METTMPTPSASTYRIPISFVAEELGVMDGTSFLHISIENEERERLWLTNLTPEQIATGQVTAEFHALSEPAWVVCWEYSLSGWGKRTDWPLRDGLTYQPSDPGTVLQAWANAIQATPGAVRLATHRLNECRACEHRTAASWFFRAAIALLPEKVKDRHADMLDNTCGKCGCALIPKAYVKLPDGQAGCPLNKW